MQLQKKMEEYLEFNPIILTALLFVILLWSIKKRYLNPASKINLPPSPRKLPIIGNLHQLSSHPHQDLHSMAKKHGPIMLLHFGSSPALIVSSAEWAREIMKNHDIIFASRPAYKVTKKLLYDCRDIAAAPYGEYWRKMKSVMVLQLLSSKRVQSARSIRVREEETALLVEKIRESSGAVNNLSEMFAQLASDGIGRAAFGKRYSESDNGRRFLNVLSEFMEVLGFLEIGEFIPWLRWISRVNGVDKRIDRVAQEMDQVLECVIEERMQDFNGEDEECFLDIMLQIHHGQYDDLSIDKESIKPIILLVFHQDAFVGGTDTTSTALEWIMSELLRHPMAMEKLQQEVRGIVEKKQETTPDDMPYLKAVIKEGFRLHPPIPLLAPRVARQDVQINGYDVLAGTVVMINAWAIARDPVSWDEPEKFKPERFLNSSIDLKGLDFELIPFGSGRRGCPGSASSLATIEIVLANLVQKFDWKLANDVPGRDLDMTESPGISTHRVAPLLVVASANE